MSGQHSNYNLNNYAAFTGQISARDQMSVNPLEFVKSHNHVFQSHPSIANANIPSHPNHSNANIHSNTIINIPTSASSFHTDNRLQINVNNVPVVVPTPPRFNFSQPPPPLVLNPSFHQQNFVHPRNGNPYNVANSHIVQPNATSLHPPPMLPPLRPPPLPPFELKSDKKPIVCTPNPFNHPGPHLLKPVNDVQNITPPRHLLNVPPVSIELRPPYIQQALPNILPVMNQAPVNPCVMQGFIPTPFTLFNPPLATYDLKQEAISVNEDKKVEDFKLLLQKFQKPTNQIIDKKDSSFLVSEYVATVKESFCILGDLSKSKVELENLKHSDEKVWNQKVKSILSKQNQLCELITRLSCPKTVNVVLNKLQKVKKKRQRIKKRKEELRLLHEVKMEERSRLHSEIDRWYESLREKDLQRKKDAELKKEADYILSEVHKKIHEAKRTMDKLKVLGKLREVRKENSVKKGMLILLKYDENFENKLSEMKKLMAKQLADYEAEERALKVMLETEQEGQRELEAQWRLKRLKKFQEKKQSNIIESLFGNSADSELHGDMFLFHQYYDAGNKNMQNLIQIRHDWDMFLIPPDSTDGDSVPQEWVTPDPPSNDIWKSALGDEL